MGRALDRGVLAGAGLVVALLIVDAVLAYRNTRQLDEDAGWVAHTHEVMDLTSDVLLTVVDAETGERGFLISGKDEFLQPYDDALKRLDERMARLKEKTEDNARQQTRIKQLEEMIGVRIALLRQAIDLRRRNDAAQQALTADSKGKEQMDAIRALVAEMEQEEQNLLKEREGRSKRAFVVAVTTGLLTTLVGLALIGAFIWLLGRSLAAREKAAATIREQRELLEVTLSSIGDAVIATDRAGRVTFLNPVALRLTAWTQEEAAGAPLETVFNIVNEETRQPVENAALRAIHEGVIVGLANHTLLIARDGTEHPIDDSAAPIRDAAGRVVGGVLVFRDITARREAEVALAERVRLLALGSEVGAALTQGDTLRDTLQRCTGALVEHLDGAFARIWTANPAGEVLELQASAGLYTHTDGLHGRVPVGQFKIGRIARERRPHLTNAVIGDREVPEQDWAQREGLVAFAGYPLVVEDRLVGVMAMFARHPLSPPTLAAMASVADEIALGIERKRAEQEVARLLDLERQRSERLRQVAAASLTINAATTPMSVVGVIRVEAQRIIGTDQSDVRLQPEDRPSPVVGLTAPLIGRGGRPLGHISVAGKADGQFTEDDAAILTQLAHMAAVAFDNARLYEELREGDRRKDEFLATLAHELRNPLAPIRNSLQVMRLAGNNARAAEDSRATIERQVRQMVRLIDDLLDLSRISRGKLELRKERVELAAVLNSALETSRPLIEQSGHQLTVALPGEPISLEADPTRLAQVFSNLLNNAAKYTERDGQIRLTAERKGDSVTVRVRDNGVGISAEMLPRIFEMFTQVGHSLERSQGGLGIGLTLVRRLAEMHGGTVEAHSAGPGCGSEFVVRLSVAPDMKFRAAQGSPENGESVAARPCRRILVVDDNRDAVDSLTQLLRMLGNDVQAAYDGMEAVDAAARFRPEVVLLDIGLPRLNGFEAARRIREQPGGQGMVLIALTGWGQESDRKRSREAGFDQHLTKPVELETLQRLLADLPRTGA